VRHDARVQRKTPLRLTLDDGVEGSVVHHAGHAVFPFDELGVAHDSGVIDQNVDPSVPGHDVVDGGLYRGGIGDVDLGIGRDVPRHDVRPLGGESFDRGAADAAAPPVTMTTLSLRLRSHAILPVLLSSGTEMLTALTRLRHPLPLRRARDSRIAGGVRIESPSPRLRGEGAEGG